MVNGVLITILYEFLVVRSFLYSLVRPQFGHLSSVLNSVPQLSHVCHSFKYPVFSGVP